MKTEEHKKRQMKTKRSEIKKDTGGGGLRDEDERRNTAGGREINCKSR